MLTTRASLVAQSIKNLPAMQETWIQFLGRECHQKKEMATHSSILAWKTPGQRSLVGYSPGGFKRVRHNIATKYANYIYSTDYYYFLKVEYCLRAILAKSFNLTGTAFPQVKIPFVLVQKWCLQFLQPLNFHVYFKNALKPINTE